MVGSFKSSQVGAVRARAAAAGGARLVIISSEHTLADDMAFQKISVVDNKDMWRQILAAVLANGWYSAEYKQTHADRLSSMIIDMEGLTIGEQAVQLAEMYTRARKAMILVDGYSVDSETMGLIAEVVLMTESAESLGRIILVSSSTN